ncbi:MAG: xanthan lyase, partial [Tannerellaceae bacterium]
APKEWIVTTGPQYYGTTQMSAHAIKTGKGNVYAEWKAPIPEHGTYDIYYYVSKTEDINWNRHVKAEYHFSIDGSDKIEDAYLDIRRAKDGWESLGPYYIEKDTAVIKLYNDYALRAITADAIKLVKRY